MAKTADKILYGNIYTVDEKQPRAAACAIADGRFVYVGDEAGAKAYIGEGTQELRYENGVILPGLGEDMAISLRVVPKRSLQYT